MKVIYPPTYSSVIRVIHTATGKNPIRHFWDATTGVMDIVAFDEHCKKIFRDYNDNMSLSEFLQKKDPTLWLAVVAVFDLSPTPKSEFTEEMHKYILDNAHRYIKHESKWTELGFESYDGMFVVESVFFNGGFNSMGSHYYHIYNFHKGDIMTESLALEKLGRLQWADTLRFYRIMKKHGDMGCAELKIRQVFENWDGKIKSLPKNAWLHKAMHWSHGMAMKFNENRKLLAVTAKDGTRFKYLSKKKCILKKCTVTSNIEKVYVELYKYLKETK